jgi:hypothetical protein
MLQRDPQPSVIYRALEDVQNFRVELCERNHGGRPLEVEWLSLRQES